MTTEQVKLKPCPFDPKRVIARDLESGAKVELFYDGERFGLQCFNIAGERTRALISAEGMAAMVSAYHALSAGGGDEIKREWVAIPADTLVREPVARPNPPSPDAGERREVILRERVKALVQAQARQWFCSGDDCTEFDHGRDEGLRLALAAIDLVDLKPVFSPAPDADTVMVQAVREFIAALTNGGRNEANCLSFDHDRLSAAIAQGAEALAAFQVKPDPLPGFCAENAHNSTGKPGEVQ